MGVMTLVDLRSELLFQLRNRTDTAASGGGNPDRLTRWVNWSYLHVCHPNVVGHWELMQSSDLTLTTTTNEYAFNPLGGRRVTGLMSVSHIDATVYTSTARRTKLRPRDIRYFDDRSFTVGPPHAYAVFGNNLVLDNTPGANENNELLRVRAVLEPVALVADPDATVLDSVWDEVIILGARWRALRDLDMPDKAELAKQDFAALLAEYEDKDAFHGMEWDWVAEVQVAGYQEGDSGR